VVVEHGGIEVKTSDTQLKDSEFESISNLGKLCLFQIAPIYSAV